MRTWALLLACSMVARSARVLRIARQRSSEHIAGILVHNYAALHEPGRADFLRHVKRDSAEGREHWILAMRRGLSVEKFDSHVHREGVAVFGAADLLPFIEFRGTEEALTELLLDIGSDVEAVEPDLPTKLAGHEYVDSRGALLPKLETTQTTTVVVAPDTPVCQWNMRLIGADHRKHTGRGVQVYVLDTGIRISHEEFKFGRAKAMFDIDCDCCGPICVPYDCTRHPAPHCDEDPNGHGTHVAGTIGGIRFGVAPDVTLHSLKVLDSEGAGAVSWAVAALNHLLDRGHRPAVVSFSLGTEKNQAVMLRHYVNLVIDQGFTVVVAAGNRNVDACTSTPADVSNAITVGSMFLSSKDLERESSFSNDGPCVDIYAPGEVIMAAYAGADRDYAYLTGTSTACAHVTGAAALALQGVPLDHTPADVKVLMTGSFTEEGKMLDIPDHTPNLRLMIGPSGPVCKNENSGAYVTGLVALPALLAFLAWRSF